MAFERASESAGAVVNRLQHKSVAGAVIRDEPAQANVVVNQKDRIFAIGFHLNPVVPQAGRRLTNRRALLTKLKPRSRRNGAK